MDYMGTPHSSKPAIKADKIMSKRHKKTRKWISKIKDKKEKIEQSIHYNNKHKSEHEEQEVKSKDALKHLKNAFKRSKKS